MPTSCFCEAIRPSAVAQPSNALSSLAFCITAGILLAFRASPSFRSTAHDDAPVYASALLLIGFGSAFYHASLTFVGQTFDVLGMYLLVTAILLWNLRRLRDLSRRASILAYVTANVVLFGVLIAFPGLRRYAFAGLVIAVLCLEYRLRDRDKRNARYLLGALGVLAIGFAIWIADITGIVCQPWSWVQGHSIWHVCGAVSAGLVFLHYHQAEADIE
jgi:hypothetical protein